MDEPTTLAAVKRVHSALNHADIPALMDALTEDVEWEMFGLAALPFGGLRRGREQVKDWYEQLLATCRFDKITREEYVTQGDTCIALGYAWGTYRPTGRPVQGHYCQVFTVRDGKVCRFRDFLDTAAWLAAARKSA